MYFAIVILLLFVCPVASIAVESLRHPHAQTLIFLTAKWFVFWSVGLRLFLAGIRQVAQPRFTAEEIFNLREPAAFPIVRELGFANLSMGLLGLLSLLNPQWIVPAAIAGGLYYGLAGAGHIAHSNRNAKENTAMFSDLFLFAVLLTAVLRTLV